MGLALDLRRTKDPIAGELCGSGLVAPFMFVLETQALVYWKRVSFLALHLQ